MDMANPSHAAGEPERERARALGQWVMQRLVADGRPAAGLTVENLRAPGAGLSSDTQLFEATWRENGEPHALAGVVRAAPRAEGPFPEYDLALQFHVMHAVGRHTACPVPEVLWLEEDARVLGTPFLVMRQVEGRAPLDIRPSYQAAGFYHDASPATRRRMWQGVVEATAALHAADWRGLAIPGLPGTRKGEDPATAALAYWRHYFADWLKDAPEERVPVFDEALAYLEAERPAPARLGLCWGDAKLGNVMFSPSEGRVAAVVDWEMATLGDPEMDIASLHLSDLRARDDAGGNALAGTPDADELVELYESAGGTRVRNFHYHLVFAAFWRGAVALKVMRRMRAQGLDVPDAAFHDHLPVRVLRRLLDL